MVTAAAGAPAGRPGPGPEAPRETPQEAPRSEDRATRVARLLSDVVSPAVSVSLICVLCGVAGHPQPLAGLGWAVLLSGFCAAVPVSTIHVAVRSNHLSDRHVTRREQRWWVLLVCTGSVLCGTAVARGAGAPPLLIWILLTMVAGLALTGAVTLAGTKVSMHAFCLTAAILAAALVVSPWWLLALLPLLPAVAFARLRLRHHTPGEITLGMVLAVAVMLTARLLMPPTA
ncbi:hypothetical protein [Actinomyces wuliandei]|uniref:hypothetical protein n=1 Tax=Actinomyces wuliandei TaxID=2057743 RepID=UPI00111A4C94|nr:hypothetical protein [Actinomyces wuliandei]